jgi:hypothetical protein
VIGTNSWRGPARAYHTDIAHYYPGKRDGGSGDLEPSADEIAHGKDWLERELAMARGRPARGRRRARQGIPRPEPRCWYHRWYCRPCGRSLSDCP